MGHSYSKYALALLVAADVITPVECGGKSVALALLPQHKVFVRR